jgi:hypothetical protein
LGSVSQCTWLLKGGTCKWLCCCDTDAHICNIRVVAPLRALPHVRCCLDMLVRHDCSGWARMQPSAVPCFCTWGRPGIPAAVQRLMSAARQQPGSSQPAASQPARTRPGQHPADSSERAPSAHPPPAATGHKGRCRCSYMSGRPVYTPAALTGRQLDASQLARAVHASGLSKQRCSAGRPPAALPEYMPVRGMLAPPPRAKISTGLQTRRLPSWQRSWLPTGAGASRPAQQVPELGTYLRVLSAMPTNVPPLLEYKSKCVRRSVALLARTIPWEK